MQETSIGLFFFRDVKSYSMTNKSVVYSTYKKASDVL